VFLSKRPGHLAGTLAFQEGQGPEGISQSSKRSEALRQTLSGMTNSALVREPPVRSRQAPTVSW